MAFVIGFASPPMGVGVSSLRLKTHQKSTSSSLEGPMGALVGEPQTRRCPMGAVPFYTSAHGKTPEDAFQSALGDALHHHGYGGYTGTLAEKDSFVVIDVPSGTVDVEAFAMELVERRDPRLADKWGPAGCVLLREGKEENEYLLFGWASF